MAPGFLRRRFNQSGDKVVAKGLAKDRMQEGDAMVPTVEAEVADITEDKEAAESAALSTEQLAPGSDLASDARAAAARAEADEKVAEDALARASGDATAGHTDRDAIRLGTFSGVPTGDATQDAAPIDQALSAPDADLAAVETDLEIASRALADADAAKAQAEADAMKAATQAPTQGTAGTLPGS